MNKALSFVRLDFITIKSYLTWKNLLIFGGLAVFMVETTGKGYTAIGILMMLGSLYASYPFAVGEKSNIDALYTTLSIKRSTVVLGRYLFSLVLSVCAGAVAYIFAFAALTFLQKEFNATESLMVVVVMFLFVSIFQAIQLSIFFKFGYTKARLMAYLPLFAISLLAVVVVQFMGDAVAITQIAKFGEWVAANPLIFAGICAIAWLAIMAASYKISLSFYRKRDF